MLKIYPILYFIKPFIYLILCDFQCLFLVEIGLLLVTFQIVREIKLHYFEKQTIHSLLLKKLQF